jgi:hypothetical protein
MRVHFLGLIAIASPNTGRSCNTARSQTMPKEELIFLTSEWKGERFPDGRPKVPDALIARAKNISIEEAWVVLAK